MPPTTLLKRRAQMPHRDLPNCHGGNGALDFTVVLDGREAPGMSLAFFHDDVVPPGASIGRHAHADTEEYYYILSGNGTMILDGVEHPVGAGDVTAVFPGGEHGLENRSDAPLRVLVICPKRLRTPGPGD